jgi:hypothetical protein
MKRYFLVVAISAFLGCSHLAYADGCAAVATSAGVDQEGNSFPAGDKEDELGIYQTNPDGTPEWYSQEGGDIYPANKYKLTNCHFNIVDGQTTLVFNDTGSLGGDNSSGNNGHDDHVKDTTEQELENDGIDDADAGNAADWAFDHPDSQCAADVNTVINGINEMNAMNNMGGPANDQTQATYNDVQAQVNKATNAIEDNVGSDPNAECK